MRKLLEKSSNINYYYIELSIVLGVSVHSFSICWVPAVCRSWIWVSGIQPWTGQSQTLSSFQCCLPCWSWDSREALWNCLQSHMNYYHLDQSRSCKVQLPVLFSPLLCVILPWLEEENRPWLTLEALSELLSPWSPCFSWSRLTHLWRPESHVTSSRANFPDGPDRSYSSAFCTPVWLTPFVVFTMSYF